MQTDVVEMGNVSSTLASMTMLRVHRSRSKRGLSIVRRQNLFFRKIAKNAAVAFKIRVAIHSGGGFGIASNVPGFPKL